MVLLAFSFLTEKENAVSVSQNHISYNMSHIKTFLAHKKMHFTRSTNKLLRVKRDNQLAESKKTRFCAV